MSQEVKTQTIALSKLHLNTGQIKDVPKNPRFIKDERFAALKKSIQDDPEMLNLRELVAYDNNGELVIILGNMRYRAMKELGYKDAPVKVLPTATEAKKLRAYIQKDNIAFGQNDWDLLGNEWDVAELEDFGLECDFLGGVEDVNLDESKSEQEDSEEEKQLKLTDKFIIPPFSILDSKQGYWQERKRNWKKIVVSQGETRKDLLFESYQTKYPELYKKTQKERKKMGIGFKEYIDNYVSPEELAKYSQTIQNGVSLFDPVLAEIICKWFTPYKGAKIFDCFAGDTLKGLVFAKCGYEFCGIELRQEQVDENNKQIANQELPIRYICDDGQNVAKHFDEQSQDLLFSCPPYFNLEVYSDKENDASNQKDYYDFVNILKKAFGDAYKCLKDNRFAVIVCGTVRSKKDGSILDMPRDVEKIFTDLGASFLTEFIYAEMLTSASLRANMFAKTRKPCKTHQNVLVFYKGNLKDIKNEFPILGISNEEINELIGGKFVMDES